MNIRVNGTPWPHQGGDLEELLRERGQDPERAGVAVAVNGQVVPRRQWRTWKLAPGDDVEIVSAVQGG